MIRSLVLPIAIAASYFALSSHADTIRARPEASVPKTATPPIIDGHLDDEVWNDAVVITNMPSMIGDTATPEELSAIPTKIRLLWDANYLYVSFHCTDPDILTTFTQHDDPLHKEDVVEVFIDASGESREWYEFQVNPKGVNLDAAYALTGPPTFGPEGRLTRPSFRYFLQFIEWDEKDLQSGGVMFDNGWTVELAIPSRKLVHRSGRKVFEPMTLRANFVRYERNKTIEKKKQKLVTQNWAPVLLGNPHTSPAAMGFLHLVDSK